MSRFQIMDKTFARLLLILLVALLFFGVDIWIKQQDKEMPGTNEQYYKIVSLPIPDSLTFAGEEIPLDIFCVSEALDRELTVNTYWHSSTLRLIKKSHRWFPLFDSILGRNNIPLDFKYLCVIESGISNVVSPAGATGYWQFMKATAKEYGLEVDKDVDERYHVVKSTKAACKYLLKSYEKYKDWALVAASYNAGQNGINRQLKKQKVNSYFDLLLSEETSRYLYRILAVKIIFEDPESFGFYIDDNEFYQPVPTHIVKVSGKVESWADFAKEQGITYKLLKYFNPWLRQGSLKNRKKKTYEIMIPDAPYNMTHEEILTRTN